MKFIARALTPTLKRSLQQFPALVLTGPRQSGKTTLLKKILGKRWAYASLESPALRAEALSDPEGFLARLGEPLILDEIQYGPELIPRLKEAIDSRRGKRGRFALTGSQPFALMKGVSESLAGRAAILDLLPLSLAEIHSDPGRPLPWEKFTQGAPAKGDLWNQAQRGLFPEMAAHPKSDASLWQESYLRTYLERDLRDLRHVGDLRQFQIFMRALALRSGQLLNMADLARDLGLALNTVKQWISVLEASWQVFLLYPYFENQGKRLVKTPKLYFLDTGLFAALTGIHSGESARQGALAGALFESLAVTEVYKRLSGQGRRPELYFWRTSDGQEVDLVVPYQGRLVPVEIKSSSTPSASHAKTLHAFRAQYGAQCTQGWLVHGGKQLGSMGPGVQCMPLSLL